MLHVGSGSIPSGTSVARFENAGGTCTITPNTTGGITCTSDINLKKDVTSWDTDALDVLSHVEVKSYRMKADDSSSTKQVGFIAQDLEQYFPWLVATDVSGVKSVSYAGMTPIIVQAIQQIEKFISGAYTDVTLWVTGIKADKVTTKTLCVEDVCVTKDQFLKMVQQENQAPATALPVPSSAIPDPSVTDTPSTPDGDSSASSTPVTPDVTTSTTVETVEPAAEPAPIVDIPTTTP
jgi:hypothetical protein